MSTAATPKQVPAPDQQAKGANMNTTTAEKKPTVHTAPSTDPEKLSEEELFALAEKYTALAQSKSVKKFEDAVNYVVAAAKGVRKSKLDVVNALVNLMDTEERIGFNTAYAVAVPKAPKAASTNKGPRAYTDLDKEGNRPQPGITYKHASIATPWTKAANGLGATNKEYKAVAPTTTWEAMAVKK